MDAELHTAFVARDQRAVLSHLMRLYGHPILRFAWLMTNSDTVSEELRVQIFVDVYGALGQVTDCATLRAHLWGTAHRNALDACRIEAALRRRDRRTARAPATDRRAVPSGRGIVLCNRYWAKGVVLVEAGQPDPHRDTCPACQAAHRLRNEIIEALVLIGANVAGEPDWSARVWERIALHDGKRIP